MNARNHLDSSGSLCVAICCSPLAQHGNQFLTPIRNVARSLSLDLPATPTSHESWGNELGVQFSRTRAINLEDHVQVVLAKNPWQFKMEQCKSKTPPWQECSYTHNATLVVLKEFVLSCDSPLGSCMYAIILPRENTEALMERAMCYESTTNFVLRLTN